MTIKLTDAQLRVLSLACQRDDCAIHPLPKGLVGGAANKVLKVLIAKGLAEEVTDDNGTAALFATAAAETALGLDPSRYRVTFQSRFGPAKWLQPYTADVLAELGAARTPRVQDAIAEVFLRSGYRGPGLAGLVAEHRVSRPGEGALVDALLASLAAPSILGSTP